MNVGLKQLAEKEKKFFFNTYKRFDLDIGRGAGCWLITKSGKRILDMFSGLAVNVLGYNHPELIKAIEVQMHKYIHVSNFFYQETQILLAEEILKQSGFSKLFFTNSGTEAVEGSIKIVRQYFRNTGKRKLISFSGSYHGRSYGSLSLTSRPKYRDGFEPFIPDTLQLEFNSVQGLERSIDDSTAAVYLECIQGEGGINVVTAEFANKLKTLHDKYGFLIICDEIQSGVGRTGRLHSFEHFGLQPDIVVIAKGMGGGLPLGAILGSEKVSDVLSVGEHGSTFGGNPVAAACGIVIFRKLSEGLMSEVKESAAYLRGKLKELQEKYKEKIIDVKGLGLMLGIELRSNGAKVVSKLLEQGVLVNCTNQTVIRLLPPYIINREELDIFTDKFDFAIERL